MFVEHVYEFTHRHVRVVAVQQVNVRSVSAETFERSVELRGEAGGVAVRRVRALGDHDKSVAQTAAVLHPLAEQAFGFTAAVTERRVEAVAARFHESVENGGGMRVGPLVVATDH